MISSALKYVTRCLCNLWADCVNDVGLEDNCEDKVKVDRRAATVKGSFVGLRKGCHKGRSR